MQAECVHADCMRTECMHADCTWQVRVVVHEHAPAAEAASAESRYTATLRPGTPMSDVARAVDAANPDVRLIEIGTADIRRLCKWLGSTVANRRFNALARYVLHEQSRYCPGEDHDEKVGACLRISPHVSHIAAFADLRREGGCFHDLPRAPA